MYSVDPNKLGGGVKINGGSPMRFFSFGNFVNKIREVLSAKINDFWKTERSLLAVIDWAKVPIE